MTLPVDLPAPTGQTTYMHGATYRADGTTQLTASAAAALVSTPSSADPLLVVAENIYETRIPDGTVYPAMEKVLLFPKGAIIRTSVWQRAFPAVTVTSMTPATGTHLGGTVVTMVGANFTPGTTVHVGGALGTSVTITSPGLFTFTTPAGTAGVADVTVTNDNGTLDLGNVFTFS